MVVLDFLWVRYRRFFNSAEKEHTLHKIGILYRTVPVRNLYIIFVNNVRMKKILRVRDRVRYGTVLWYYLASRCDLRTYRRVFDGIFVEYGCKKSTHFRTTPYIRIHSNSSHFIVPYGSLNEHINFYATHVQSCCYFPQQYLKVRTSTVLPRYLV